MNQVHELKCWPEHFRTVRSREKPFEVRKNDRDYQVGDTLILWEWIPPERWIEQYEGDGYTGELEIVTVTYVLDDPAYCLPGHVVLGLGFDDWISVKDRLPEQTGTYLVAFPAGPPNVAEIKKLEHLRLFFDKWGILYWRPLPEPPTADQ